MLTIYDEAHIQRLTKKRPGSIKIGETIGFVPQGEHWEVSLASSYARFVILGVIEDIGTQASKINTNSRGLLDDVLEQLLNFQDNLYLSGADILLLGEVPTQDLSAEISFLGHNEQKVHYCVDRIDQRLEEVMVKIFESGKIPVVIGGGQNNAYPILKALSKVQNRQVNTISVAAQTCLMPPTTRSARNAYSFGLLDGFLNRLYVLGLHESEIPHSIYEFILANFSQIGLTRFEAILKNSPGLDEAIQDANNFVTDLPFGLDINANCMADYLISPQYPDGFLLREIRNIIRRIIDFHQPAYLLLCEANSGEENSNENDIIGKSLALLITDFIKSSNYDEEE